MGALRQTYFLIWPKLRGVAGTLINQEGNWWTPLVRAPWLDDGTLSFLLAILQTLAAWWCQCVSLLTYGNNESLNNKLLSANEELLLFSCWCGFLKTSYLWNVEIWCWCCISYPVCWRARWVGERNFAKAKQNKYFVSCKHAGKKRVGR